MTRRQRATRARWTLLGSLVTAALAAGPSRAGSGRSGVSPQGTRLPAAAAILTTTATVRGTTSTNARQVAVFPQFRRDFRPTVLRVLGRKHGTSGVGWVRVAVPGRPNGRQVWVLARSLHVRPVAGSIVVDLSARRLMVAEGGRTRFATRVAIGRRCAETPLGLIYVTAVLQSTERYLDAYAFETSASKLSDWPGGGIVGLHGTNQPELLGQAVSHGCIRMSNAAARALKRLAPARTPLRIVR